MTGCCVFLCFAREVRFGLWTCGLLALGRGRSNAAGASRSQLKISLHDSQTLAAFRLGELFFLFRVFGLIQHTYSLVKMVKRKREEVKNAAGAQKGKSARFEEGAVTKSKSASEKSKNQSDTKSKSKSKGKSDKVAGVPKPSSKSVAIGESPAALSVHTKAATEQISVQIVTGSYERVLHGFAASIPGNLVPNASSSKDDGEGEEAEKKLSVSDTFLFAAHSSALRCLAVSPSTESHKRILATGSTDERINLFSLSTSPPAASSKPQLPTLSQTNVLENSRNRELGSLLHHTRSINKLQFPTRGKLFSSADDNTIAISRTRDWTVLSTIKVPVPKAVGRPSGDTAGPGEVPTGVNDFAIHPSMKVMVSVAKGERSMRLWNLVTGKKAGVLNFDKDLLQAVGEGRYSSGEGRKVLWTEDGEEFVIGFERGAVIYGMVSSTMDEPRCKLMLTNIARTLCQRPPFDHHHPQRCTKCASCRRLMSRKARASSPCQPKMDGYCSMTRARSCLPQASRSSNMPCAKPSLSWVASQQASRAESKILRFCRCQALSNQLHRHFLL